LQAITNAKASQHFAGQAEYSSGACQQLPEMKLMCAMPFASKHTCQHCCPAVPANCLCTATAPIVKLYDGMLLATWSTAQPLLMSPAAHLAVGNTHQLQDSLLMRRQTVIQPTPIPTSKVQLLQRACGALVGVCWLHLLLLLLSIESNMFIESS
jgi:hypothetical protein